MSPQPASRRRTDACLVRDAARADLPAILAIEAQAFSTDRISPRAFTRLLSRSSAAVLVAVDSGKVLGCAVVLFRAYSSRARLYSIAVAEHGRGQGVGAALLDAAEMRAATRGCRVLGLEVREDNGGAIALYGRRGYEPIGRTPDYYADGAAALHFRKALPANAREAA